MAWLYLIVAGVFEIGWPLGFKLSPQPEYRFGGIVGASSRWARAAGCCGWPASDPIGTAYAVWTGIGGAGTFVIGLLLCGDGASAMRWLGVALIISGVVVLKL